MLNKPVLIHVCKDKTLTYRTRNQPIFNGVAFPVFSVDTPDEADQLLLLVGRRQYHEHPQIPGKPWLKCTLDGQLDFKPYLDIADLPAVTAKLGAAYERITTRA